MGELLDWLILVFSFGAMALGGLVVVMNWVSLFQTLYTGRFHSAIPLVGTVLLGLGLLLQARFRPYAWIAIFDFGTLSFLYVLPRLVKEAWATSRFNLLEEYVGEQGIKKVRLRLFRTHRFILRQEFHRGAGEVGLSVTSTIGKWERDRQLKLVRYDGPAAVLEFSPEADGLTQVSGFADYEADPGQSLAGMVLKLTYEPKARS